MSSSNLVIAVRLYQEWPKKFEPSGWKAFTWPLILSLGSFYKVKWPENQGFGTTFSCFGHYFLLNYLFYIIATVSLCNHKCSHCQPFQLALKWLLGPFWPFLANMASWEWSVMVTMCTSMVEYWNSGLNVDHQWNRF